MFFEGDLKSGINKALQESKLVACFVTDAEDESNLWEHEFLEDIRVKSLLSSETILLRLEAGSQEAGYLAAIFPLPKTPTLVIIQDGQLKEYITSGVAKDEFLRRLAVVFQSRVKHTGESPASTNTTAASTQQQASSSRTPAESSESPSSQIIQDMLSERGAKLEAQKKEQDAKEREKRKAEAKARKEALEASLPEGSKRSADMKYALMQKKRQQEARDERARILKRVEDDKAERKDKEAQRKALAKAIEDSQKGEVMAPSNSSAPSSRLESAGSRSKVCALQVRLFDGTTIRSSFPSDATLGGQVRAWINQETTGDVPYNFKQVLTPLPNKNLSVSEEGQSLQSQGLTPSATLILVPVPAYTSAYEGGGATGLISKGVAAGYGLVSSGVGLVTGVLGGFLGGGVAPTQMQPSTGADGTSSPKPASSKINVRTLRDQERPEDHQFYNGNALNFEPRKDEDDKKED